MTVFFSFDTIVCSLLMSKMQKKVQWNFVRCHVRPVCWTCLWQRRYITAVCTTTNCQRFVPLLLFEMHITMLLSVAFRTAQGQFFCSIKQIVTSEALEVTYVCHISRHR